ncbi:Bbiotin--acetyl-CoA-carboxylase ligase [Desulfonema limicola]|uniref:Bifunctional ligase/repressor BirA n=1 Tax=Desulfonema limicola TaxID=45656 RepID=A0A975B5Q4_9BACT|nr:biotin--[acetyl-CoA-carboxylase] ligase [Desulfonema limicola]QTA79252.1 Bbiotin--acetyl-CoA-carboxylase ligase [Desulfonema limicola]
MKNKILKILTKTNGIKSGEKLSSELGVSRVSIWKHINKLREAGYEIISTPKGYYLENNHDYLFPWEFPKREADIHYFPETESTMDIARNLARKGCPDFTIVIAEKQTRGRGRLQRTWLSEKGGLFFTMVLRPVIPPVLSSRVNFAASCSLARVINHLFNIDAKVKWPNDILVCEKKISGMLSEMEADGDLVSFINIGMGINVNNDPTPYEPNAASLKILAGKEISRKELLSAFLDDFQSAMKNIDYDKIIDQWKQYTMTLGRYVSIATTKDVSRGLAIDVDKDGALILELADGKLKKIIYGDCFVQPPKKQ